MNTLKSFNGDTKLKEVLLKEIIRHRKADQIIQGSYGENGDNFKGCAVGCSIHSLNVKFGKNYNPSDHTVYEKELGMPEWLARLEDKIFEGLPKEDSMKWPEQFIKAVPVGVNLEKVKWQFCSYLLKENIDRVLGLKISDSLKEQVVSVIRQVLSVHETAIKTGKWDGSAAKSAEWSAWSAARSAERSAESAAWSAEWSAESAAESAARSAAYIKYSKELLKLLKSVK